MPRRQLLAACLLLVAGAVRADDPPATKTIAKLNATLFDALQHAQQLGYQGRFDEIAPAVDDAFDVAFMAEKSIGKYWKPLSEADRARWTALFKDYTTATYAGNFDHFANQRFEIHGEEPSQNEITVVHAKVVVPGGEDADLDYRLHATPSGPKVVDVYLKKTVSQLALQRSDFTSVLERQGFDGLLASVRGKISDLAAGRGKRQPG